MVGDEREVPAQFDHARQLAPVLAGLADRKGGCFIDGEHRRSLDLSAWQEQAGVQNAMCNADRKVMEKLLLMLLQQTHPMFASRQADVRHHAASRICVAQN